MKVRLPIKKSLIILASISSLLLLAANYWVLCYSQYTRSSVAELPQEYACLVLGTSKLLSSGSKNLFYEYRMDAALAAYSSGKCTRIVVSGDNRHNNYNEPDQMKDSLVAMGIPSSAIFCDYAGGRTLDSVIRFREIFGQSSGIVVSQQFHNERAIFIARHHGINLMGFNAREVDAYNAFRTKLREIFSRLLAVLDVVVFHSGPRHLGEKVPI